MLKVSQVCTMILFLVWHFEVSASEMKIWIVPRMDTRNMTSVRYQRDFAFPSVKQENLPIFVSNMRKLWDKCFNNESHQQPTRPASISSTTPVRFLTHSSIKSGWSHLFASFYQLSKVFPSSLFLLLNSFFRLFQIF